MKGGDFRGEPEIQAAGAVIESLHTLMRAWSFPVGSAYPPTCETLPLTCLPVYHPPASLSLPACPSIHPPTHPPAIHLSINPHICLSIHPATIPFIYPPTIHSSTQLLSLSLTVSLFKLEDVVRFGFEAAGVGWRMWMGVMEAG